MIALDESSHNNADKTAQRATDWSKLGADFKYQIMSLHDPSYRNNDSWTQLQLH